MTCKLNSLFSIGEDFDDEDLLETDWTVRPACGAALGAAAVSPGALRAPSASRREAASDGLERSEQKSATLCDITAWHSGSAAAAAGQSVSQGLRQLSSSSAQPAPLRNSLSDLAPQQRANDAERPPKAFQAPDDFDDWDVDLADLEECDRQMGWPPQPPAPPPPVPVPVPASSAKALRPPSHGGIQTRPGQCQREPSAARQPPGSSSRNAPAAPVSSLPRPAFVAAASPHGPQVFQARSPVPRPVPRPVPSPVPSPVPRPQQPQRQWATPGPSNQTRSVFQTASPAPSTFSSTFSSASTMSPNPLHTPVLTNRLVQLVSASSKRPSKRPRLEGHRSRTRRFPGPAGLLPEQPLQDVVDKVVVSVPLIPAHGAVARLSSTQASSSQAEEDDFSGGAWAAMKAEMGLDERNPSCFLHSCSVVMVLRKAALKQLPKNKVPNMAVLLRSLVHTHADAKAVFKDPTGEIQGTLHRRLLVDREEELQVGAVLLLKQVGVFSPSHRNHYLNVTANNLLRVYSPDGLSLSSTPLPPLVLEPMLPSPIPRRSVSREPVSQMQLMFDEEDDGGQEMEAAADPRTSRGTEERRSGGATAAEEEEAARPPAASWGLDDDLDELLGELPDDSYSL